MLFFVIGCQPDSSNDASTTTTQSVRVNVPMFERDSAFSFIEQQVSFGPRVPESPGHKAAREWLVGKLKSYGAEVIEQDFKAKTYTGTEFTGTNIIGQFNPSIKKRVLLAAHWDTRFMADQETDKALQSKAILGADDGGSGVGVLLEVARQLHLNPIDMGVDVIFFDAEDQGEDGGDNTNSWCLGAQHWARNLHVPGYRPKYGILLDMVGAKDARFAFEGTSMQYAGKLMRKVWDLAKRMGYGNYFVPEQERGVTDDHVFVNAIAGIEMIDIINRPKGTTSGFGPHWHTHKDDMEVIDKRTLRAVGQLVLAVIYRESAGSF